ncbi:MULTISPECIES: response regulator transcription factor [unclassified Rothia (in: high G+C Gram-positive bacteria)]|uniref:response regulator n=1 Tax=unclassified Rothia (in: high G+C Gram-positive bacteria) TaxID=2689056 RepID=UPI00195D444E|nr:MULTISPECIES: response regulator transcription factor [unclassified Rothia (in: high G+C Gram-positive bacteria)]MBM7051821.1 response regulator transcription factor [Rothia sp. ZJ1223]QRZ61563.1 response regulator transcription factor [Rothia sp. ZJ932]
MAPQIRVVIVDDQPLIRMGFKMVLESTDNIQVVGEGANGLEGYDLARSLAPDVVLMDVRMPLLNGIDATAKITAETDSKVIILTTFDLDEYAFSGLRAGASAFMLKDSEPDELVRAVQVVSAGDSIVAPRITKKLVEEYIARPAAQESDARYKRQLALLTKREYEVVGAIAEGLSNAEIAQRFFVSETTVKTHVRSILTKLDVRDRVQVVVFAYESGLVSPGARKQ